MPIKFNRISSLLLLFLFTSCEELNIDPENPFEAPPDEQNPLVENLYYEPDFSSATFHWSGNKFAFSYSFRLESQSYENPVGIYINWSDWSSDGCRLRLVVWTMNDLLWCGGLHGAGLSPGSVRVRSAWNRTRQRDGDDNR